MNTDPTGKVINIALGGIGSQFLGLWDAYKRLLEKSNDSRCNNAFTSNCGFSLDEAFTTSIMNVTFVAKKGKPHKGGLEVVSDSRAAIGDMQGPIPVYVEQFLDYPERMRESKRLEVLVEELGHVCGQCAHGENVNRGPGVEVNKSCNDLIGDLKNSCLE